MENRQGQPLLFGRNRYYAEKLLTSIDFEAGQDYTINQRRFTNSLALGQGVPRGLSVFNLDDFSIMIESGAAVDGRSRRIVTEKSLVKKLSAIDEFEGLAGSRALLCFAYGEKEMHPVHVVNRQERNQEYEYNRISERYRLFLMNVPAAVADYRMETEFYSMALLYGDEGHTVMLTAPSIVSSGRKMEFSLRIGELQESSADIRVDAVPAAPAFTVVDKSHELKIQTGSVHLDAGGPRTFEYQLMAENREYENTSVITGEQDVRASGDGRLAVKSSAVNLQTSIQNITPENSVTREIGKLNPEMRPLGQKADFVPLAKFSLMRTDNAYIIDGVQKNGIKRHIPVPAQENLRTEFQSCFDEVQEEKGQEEQEPEWEGMQPTSRGKEPVWMSGAYEIPLGMRAKRSNIKYSGGIVHGLGKGRVLVQLGVYYLKEGAVLDKEGGHTVSGVSELFAGCDEAGVPRVEMTVRIANDKGSFIVVVRLLEDSQVAMLYLRWMTVRYSPEEGIAGGASGSSIMAEVPTVIIEPGSSHCFDVRFQNMEPRSLVYEPAKENSEEISKDGAYTAPAREGIYEIYICCERYPAVGTYAYVVVRRSGGTERKWPWTGITDGGKARDRDERVISRQ